MSTFLAFVPHHNEPFNIEAENVPEARGCLRNLLQMSRLPNGVIFEEVEVEVISIPDETDEVEIGDDIEDDGGHADVIEGGFPPVQVAENATASAHTPAARKSTWHDFEDQVKAGYLLEKTTIPDKAWTVESRLKGEKRADFIMRVLTNA